MAAVYKSTLSRFLFAGFLVVVSCSLSLGQVGNFRSLGTGSWNTPGTWERDADSNGSFEESPSTVAPTAITGTVTIQTGHNITMNVNTAVNSGGTIINNGQVSWNTIPLRILNINTGGSFQNNGTFSNASPSRFKFNSGSSYFHLFLDGGDIPSAEWNATSTVNITGMGSGASIRPTGLNQVFGNFVWNTPAFDNFIDLEGQPSTIVGDFLINDTGTGAVVYNFGTGLPTNNNITLLIGGDFSVTGTSQFGYTSGIGSTGSLTVNSTQTVGKGLKMSGGYFQLGFDDNVNLTINGLLSITGGDFELSASSASVNINLFGNYTYTGGTLYTSGAASSLNFSGSATRNVDCDQTPSGTLNYVVESNTTLNIPDGSFLAGTGGFTLSASSTLQVGSEDPSGALRTLSSGGNLTMTGTRIYTNPSTIVYNGVGQQFIGNGHPTVTGINTTIANSSGVSLIVGVPAIITTNLTLTSGNLNIGNGSLTLNGTLTPGSNNISIGASGSIIINGNATLGTFPFPAGAQSFANFTLNNSNGISFGNNVTLTGALTLSTGALTISNQSLTLNGTMSVTSGSLLVNSASSIIVGGSGSLGSAFNFNGSGNTLGTFTVNRASSGIVEVASTVTIANALNLTNGQLINTNGLTMGNGSTLTRSGGTLTNDNPDVVSGSYNVVYNPGSSINTGLELPLPAETTQLNNLTISGSTVLTQNLTINGNVSLTSGTFSCGSNTITMQGNTWSRAGGSFVPGTGQVTFNGNTTITATSGTPQLGNIRVESSRSLTFHSGTTAVSGNITFIAGSTINPNGGTLLLNGSGAQNFGGGGSTVNNITVTKSGGAVNLTSALSITGLLNITSATVFASSGNLTLLSSSDGTTGNASIADLSGGGSVTGDVVVQRLVSGEGRVWRYLSSPIQNASVASWKDDFPITGTFSDPSTNAEWPGLSPALTTSAVSMYRYNETVAGTRDLGWEAFPTSGLASANPLEVGRGYSAFVRITPASTVIDVTGPINSGDIAMPVTLTGTGGANNDNGWNLLGNPYPSTIDWDSPNWTKTNISGVVQIRDDPSGIFRSWNGSVGSMGSGRIATGQGFWVQAVGSPTLTARESVKTNTTGAFYKEDNLVPNAFEITLAKGADKDFAYLWFKEDATEAADADYDAAKFNNDIFDFALLTSNGTPLAINTLPFLTCGNEIKMSLSTINTDYDLTGSYTLEFSELGAISPEVKIKLIDTYAGNEMEVANGLSYVFDVDKNEQESFGSNRFKLQLIGGTAPFEVTEATGGTSCKSGSVTLNASGAPVGAVYKWYESSSSQLAVAESMQSQFTTPVLEKTKTYYVSIADELGCESAREAVTAEVVNFDDVTIQEVDNKLVSNYAEGNQWFKDGQLVSGAVGQEFTPTESGVYKVEVAIAGCSTSAERTFTVTGLENDPFMDKVLTVFPNPVENVLSVRVMDNSVTHIAITDLNGRNIGEVSLKKQGEIRHGEFDFKGRAEGVYLIQISDTNGNKASRRIVKK